MHRALGVALLLTHAGTRSPADMQPSKPQKAATTFACPDPLGTKACKSFEELRRAGDDVVSADVLPGGIAFVCFRPPDDEFFVVTLRGPSYIDLHDDPITKNIAPNQFAKSRDYGFIRAFVNGIEEPASAPINSFAGDWTYAAGWSTFAGTLVNPKEIKGDDHADVWVDNSQVSAQLRFKSRLDKSVDYRLVIQRSTGRFSEAYTAADESKVPFLQRNGRCSRLPPPA